MLTKVCLVKTMVFPVVTYESEWSEVKVAQSCLFLCDPLDYTLHGILQARIWEWVAFPFCRGSFQPRDFLHCKWILYPLNQKGSPWMSELDHKESWAPKNWCFRTVVLEKTLESPLACKEIKPDHPKGNQSWVFIGRTDAEAEIPILWPPDGKNWVTGKDPDAGKDWRQEEKGMTEDEMVGWHHWCHGHEFE